MLTSCVRSLTSSSRVRCSASEACCSRDFIATKRIVGRVTASQIASAVGVRLAALHIRLDVRRRHQPHLVPELDELAGPVMRGAACLHADQARMQLGEERQYLLPAQRLADHSRARRINTVNLKNGLGQIQADRGNIHDGWLPWLVVAR